MPSTFKKVLKVYAPITKVRKRLGLRGSQNSYQVKNNFLADYKVVIEQTTNWVKVNISAKTRNDLNEATLILETSLYQFLISLSKY